ncbi:hypothetical protein D3C86_2175340 [compost metagenome]
MLQHKHYALIKKGNRGLYLCNRFPVSNQAYREWSLLILFEIILNKFGSSNFDSTFALIRINLNKQ